jgi:hypothetical protein
MFTFIGRGVELIGVEAAGEGLHLVPLETRDHRHYRPLDEHVKPPWRKDAYEHPESDQS